MALMIIISVAAIVALGAYLRWAAKPVTTALGVGKDLGYRIGKRDRTVLIMTCARVIEERDEARAAAMGLQADCAHWEANPDEAEIIAQHRKHNPTGPQPVLTDA